MQILCGYHDFVNFYLIKYLAKISKNQMLCFLATKNILILALSLQFLPIKGPHLNEIDVCKIGAFISSFVVSFVQLGSSFKPQVQGFDQSGTLKCLMTTTPPTHHPPPPQQTFSRVLGLVGGSYLICRPI